MSKNQIKLHLLDYITSITTASRDKNQYVCPVCKSGTGDNKTGALTYYPETNTYYCFACSSKGDIYNLYADVNGLNVRSDFREIDRTLKSMYGDTLADQQPVAHDQTYDRSEDRAKKIQWVIHTAQKQLDTLNIDYLTRRGISPETQRRFGCGYFKDFKYDRNQDGTYKTTNAIIIPTSPESYMWRSTVADVKRKVGIQHIFNAVDLNNDICFVVEGEIDCMSIVELGYPCCALGSANNVGLLFRTVQDIHATLILALDNDNVGRKATNDLAKLCQQHGVDYMIAPHALYWKHKDANAALIDDRQAFSDRLARVVEIVKNRQKAANKKKMPSAANTATNSAATIGVEEKTNKKKKPPLQNCEQFSAYVYNCGYSIRYNLVTRVIEFGGFGGQESRDHLPEIVPRMLVDGLKQMYSGVSIAAVMDYITTHATRNRYNPVVDLIKSVKWDGNNYIEELYSLLGLDDSADEDVLYSRKYVQKWLMQCICGLYNTTDAPYSLDLVLVLQGAQGVGKTRLLEHLALSSAYFGEGVCLDPHDRDVVMQCTSKWIVELGELGSTMRRDIDRVKAFLTKSGDEYRAPYGKSTLHYPRITSYAGTVNDDRFLVDETGNRRFLTVKLPDDYVISYDRIKSLDALQLWAQVHYIVDQTHNLSGCFRLTEDERAYLDRRNNSYLKPLWGEEELLDALAVNQTPKPGYVCKTEEMTVSEYIKFNDLKIDARTAGKILRKAGYDSKRVKVGDTVVRKMSLPVRRPAWGTVQ